MYRVSSNLTLLFKIFLPTFWIVFFGLFTFSCFFLIEPNVPIVGTPEFRYGMLAFFLIGCAVLYLSIMKLKRVEMGDETFYASDYFRHFKFPYLQILKISENEIGPILLVEIRFRNKTSFGKKIWFLASKGRYREFINHRPDLFDHLL